MHEERYPKPRARIRGTAGEKSSPVVEREIELHAEGVVDAVEHVPQVKRTAAGVHCLHSNVVFFIDHDADVPRGVANNAAVPLYVNQFGADKPFFHQILLFDFIELCAIEMIEIIVLR